MLEDGWNSNFSGNNPILKPLWPKGGRGEGGPHLPSRREVSRYRYLVPNFLMFQGASEIRNEYDATEMLVWFHVLRRCAWILRHSQSGCCFKKKNKLANWLNSGKKEQESFTFQEEWHALWKAASDSWRTPPPPPPPNKVFFFERLGTWQFYDCLHGNGERVSLG